MDEAKTMEGPRAGRRTIGQEAGHEIHLEIEDVLEQKNKNKKLVLMSNFDNIFSSITFWWFEL